jgi:hypothetical protein
MKAEIVKLKEHIEASRSQLLAHKVYKAGKDINNAIKDSALARKQFYYIALSIDIIYLGNYLF